ncbi:MAG TPA: hypothetical protein VLX61_14045 [Anaerolineales bacterium]|nr:hypothetical protein [Anaerolineales bacterium]
MKPRTRFLFHALIFFAMLTAGCALPHNAPPFYIINPHDRTVYPLGSDIIVQYGTNVPSDSNRVNFEVEVFDNGTQVSDRLYPGTLSQASFTIAHETPGGHLLSAKGRAINRDGSVSSWYLSSVVCTFVGAPPSGTDFCSVDYVAQGLQAAPTNTPSPTPTPIPVIDSAQAYPSPIYYGDTCPSLSTVTFRAALTLPSGTTPDLVEVRAHVSVITGSVSTPSGSLLVPLLPNGTWDSATGGQVFVGTLALTHSYNDANNRFDPASLGGSSGALLWYVDASRHDPTGSTGTYLGRSANQVVDLSPCPTAGHNPPPHNGSGSQSSPSGICEQYTNATSCNLAGCSWNGTSCSVTQ